MAQITVDVEARLTGITIDPVGGRLILSGVVSEVGSERPMRHFSEDVTDSLTAGQQTTLAALVTKAETWVANKIVV